MANSNTEHSKALRRKHADAAREKAKENGCIVYVTLLNDDARIYEALAETHGGKKAALQFLLNFFKNNAK